MAGGRNLGLTRDTGLRRHAGYGGFVLHRVSGVALAMFIPAHLYVLSLAIDQGQQLDQFLRWAEQPMVKVAESALVVLLALHLFGGVRLLALEFAGWQGRVVSVMVIGIGGALALGALFLFLSA